MAEIVPLKVGEILVPKEGSSWVARFTEARLLSSNVDAGVEKWWVKLFAKSGAEYYDTQSLELLRKGWERKPKFFSVGKTYVMRAFPKQETYKVMDLYAYKDTPKTYDSMAVARVTYMDGSEDITTLSKFDFNRMQIKE